MFDSENSFAKPKVNMQITEKCVSDDVDNICNEAVEQILQVNKQISNESLIAILSGEDEVEEYEDFFLRVSDDELDDSIDEVINSDINQDFYKSSDKGVLREWSFDEVFKSLLNDDIDSTAENQIEVNNILDERSIQFTEASISKIFKYISLNERYKEFLKYFIVQNAQYLLQTAPSEFETGKLKSVNSNTFFINPRVVLERLPASVVKPKNLMNVTDVKTITPKAVVEKVECTKSYQLRNKYSANGWCDCFYDNCHFTAKGWKLMYNHIKFSHLQSNDLNSDQKKHRHRYWDVNRQLKMKAAVIIERLPTHIVNSEISIPMEQWLPYSRGIVTKEITSASEFPCIFNLCTFSTKSWKVMHIHVKLCHVKSCRSVPVLKR